MLLLEPTFTMAMLWCRHHCNFAETIKVSLPEELIDWNRPWFAEKADEDGVGGSSRKSSYLDDPEYSIFQLLTTKMHSGYLQHPNPEHTWPLGWGSLDEVATQAAVSQGTEPAVKLAGRKIRVL